jgi:hypothetical protein
MLLMIQEKRCILEAIGGCEVKATINKCCTPDVHHADIVIFN